MKDCAVHCIQLENNATSQEIQLSKTFCLIFQLSLRTAGVNACRQVAAPILPITLIAAFSRQHQPRRNQSTLGLGDQFVENCQFNDAMNVEDQ